MSSDASLAAAAEQLALSPASAGVPVVPQQEGEGDKPAAAAAPVYPPLSSLPLQRAHELQRSVCDLVRVWHEASAALLEPVRGCRRVGLLIPELDTQLIWNTFLAALPEELQVVWNGCSHCKLFVAHYGNLCVVREDGKSLPLYAVGAAEGAAAAEGAPAGGEGVPADAAKEGEEAPMVPGAGDSVKLALVPLFWNERVSSHPSLPAYFLNSVAAVRALFTPIMPIYSAFLPVLEPKQPGVPFEQRGKTIGRPSTHNAKVPAAAAAEAAAAAAASAASGGAAPCCAASPSAPHVPSTYFHMHFTFPARMCHEEDDAHQHPTRRGMLITTLRENEQQAVEHAYTWLMNDKLNYADKHKPAIAMLRRLATEWYALKAAGVHPPDDTTFNLSLWHTIVAASSPGMVSSVRSGMVSTLLAAATYGADDMDYVRRAWEAKANPVTYMRATVDPLVGNVEAAERKLKELDITMDDLKRRYLKRSEVPINVPLWRQQVEGEGKEAGAAAAAAAAAKDSGKLFGSLPRRSKKDPSPAAGAASRAAELAQAKLVSFRTFAKHVLQGATPPRTIELLLPDAIQCQFFITGELGSTPLFFFHREEEGAHRASGYTYGVTAQPLQQWGLAQQKDQWTNVHMILPSHTQWDDEPGKPQRHPQEGESYVIAISGAEDKMGGEPGLCLFPTWLRPQLHAVRSTIDSFNRNGHLKLCGAEYLASEGVAGVKIAVGDKPVPAPLWHLRVTDQQGSVKYYDIKSEGPARGLDEEEEPPKYPEQAKAEEPAAAKEEQNAWEKAEADKQNKETDSAADKDKDGEADA